MAEQSYLFDFTRVDSFIDNLNVGFFIDEMFRVTGYDSENQEYEYDDDSTIRDLLKYFTRNIESIFYKYENYDI